ncbi:MAG: hypothetical protein RL275_3362, partial [Chloroflexota bacterium]
MFRRIESLFRSDRVFIFLLLYRWLSIAPALFTLFLPLSQKIPAFITFFIVLAMNGFISIFNRPLNQAVLRTPVFMGLDIIFASVLLAASGGLESPYYLYALSPVLASAFFFQLRGALLASLFFTPLYIGAGMYASQAQSDQVMFATQLAGIWLLPILFAYPTTLLKSVNQATAELSTAHRQLEIIHDLTVLLQAAPDLLSVQERVLGAVTTELGFSKAVVALVDPALEELGGWMVYPPQDDFKTVDPLSLRSENGELIRALLNRESFTSNGHDLIDEPQLNTWLSKTTWFVTPLYLREHPVGILLVDETGLTKESESTLITVANQAALAL